MILSGYCRWKPSPALPQPQTPRKTSLFGNAVSRVTACCTHLHETEPLRVVPDCSFIQRSVNSRKHLSRQPYKHRVGFSGSLVSSTHCDSRDEFSNAWKPAQSTCKPTLTLGESPKRRWPACESKLVLAALPAIVHVVDGQHDPAAIQTFSVVCLPAHIPNVLRFLHCQTLLTKGMVRFK